jgi:hypothetical protein
MDHCRCGCGLVSHLPASPLSQGQECPDIPDRERGTSRSTLFLQRSEDLCGLAESAFSYHVPAAERIRSNVESSVAERQSTSWECPSAKVFPSPVTPTMSAAVAANRRRSGPFPPITSGMGSWIGLGSFRTAFFSSMCPPERETG